MAALLVEISATVIEKEEWHVGTLSDLACRVKRVELQNFTYAAVGGTYLLRADNVSMMHVLGSRVGCCEYALI